MQDQNREAEVLSSTQCAYVITTVPLTGDAFTQAVAVAEEVFAVVARDLLVSVNVTEHLHARRVATRRHKLKHVYVTTAHERINKYVFLILSSSIE